MVFVHEAAAIGVWLQRIQSCGALNQLTSHQDSSAHLDKQSKQQLMCSDSQIDPTAPQHFAVVLENSMATCFVYTAVVLGQPTGLSKQACLCAGADWLGSSVSQRVAKGYTEKIETDAHQSYYHQVVITAFIITACHF